MKKISIVVPSYNHGQYLNECLQSVMDQTLEDWECIIVNDGSEDNTEEIAKCWTKKDSRFRYIFQQNSGVAAARNTGINAAFSEWIVPLDGDDKLDPSYLELCLEEAAKGYDLVYTKIRLFDAENYDVDVPPYEKEKLLYYNPFYCSVLFRKEKWQLAGGYDSHMKYGLEDWEFFINIIFNSDHFRVKKIDQYVGFFYRRKVISRDVLINNNPDLTQKAFDYIVQKHWKHYAGNLNYVRGLISENINLNRAIARPRKCYVMRVLNRIIHTLKV